MPLLIFKYHINETSCNNLTSLHFFILIIETFQYGSFKKPGRGSIRNSQRNCSNTFVTYRNSPSCVHFLGSTIYCEIVLTAYSVKILSGFKAELHLTCICFRYIYAILESICTFQHGVTTITFNFFYLFTCCNNFFTASKHPGHIISWVFPNHKLTGFTFFVFNLQYSNLIVF